MAHDIGSSKFHLIATRPDVLGYSGPNSDGGALLCPTSSDINSVGQALASVTSPFSAEMWFWQFAFQSTQRLLMAWDNSAANQMSLFINTGGQIQPQVSGTFPVQSSVAVAQRWHHAVVTYDGVTIRYYLDAIAQPTIGKVGPVTITKQIGWGADPNGATSSFEGLISECALFNSTLSPTQVTNHFIAADQPSTVPVFLGSAGNGSSGSIAGGSAPPGTSDVLKFVSKTFTSP